MVTTEKEAENLRLTISRATKLAEAMLVLPGEEWTYLNFVSSYIFKEGHICGTTCCAAGWLPKIDPDNWKWIPVGDVLFPRYVGEDSASERDVTASLCAYFPAMSFNQVHAIFIEAQAFYWVDLREGHPEPIRKSANVYYVRPAHIAELLLHWVAHRRLPAGNSLYANHESTHERVATLKEVLAVC